MPKEAPKRFGEPSIASWPDVNEYSKRRNELFNSPLFHQVRKSIADTLFPLPTDVTPEEANGVQAFRKRYKIDSTKDFRIDAAARFFLCAAHAVEEVGGQLGIEIDLFGKETSSENAAMGIRPVFRKNIKAPVTTSWTFIREDGSSIAPKDITQNNAADYKLGPFTIGVNMTYVMEYRLRDAEVAVKLQEYRKETLPEEGEQMTIENIFKEVDKEFYAVFGGTAVGVLAQFQTISKRAQTPEGLLELAHQDSTELTSQENLIREYEKHAMMKWTLEFLTRYYPDTKAKKQFEANYNKIFCTDSPNH